ncbi:MAG: hypothetical protein KKA42_08885 [candidate division Zixibacteria bacterium]|nr:hypothetical protein [candidate division Zixibacteria bacterium]
MRITFLISLLVLLLALPLMAAPPKGKLVQPKTLGVDNDTWVDVNRILMFVTNHGNFGRDLGDYFGYDYGTFFPYSGVEFIEDGSNTTSPYYAGGLWVGAIDRDSGDTLVVVSEFSSEYTPGPMSGGTYSPDLPAYKVYKLFRDSLASNPNADYLNWPVDQGAPVDSLGNPEMIGDQMCWSVFNDADPVKHTNNNGTTAPLGIEVKQTVFAFDRQGALGSMVFVRLRVFNKGSRTLDNCFFSLWSDPDLGLATDDLVGCDTLLDLGYVYNETNDDQQYGATPPCLGIDFFQGPLLEGTAADTARMWGTLWPGYTNQGLFSFNKYINGTDPDDYTESYEYMLGLLPKLDGAPYVFNGDTLRFQHSGDPTAEPALRGDVDGASDDRRFMQTTGPVTFAPGDSTEILAAIIVGQGTDRLKSIKDMKELDVFAQRIYENGFNPPQPPARPIVKVAQLPGEIVLSWTDTSETDPGDYNFEGYTIWQGETPSGPWTELITYDVINEYDEGLIDTLADSYSGMKLPVVQRAVKNTGIKRFYRTSTDALTGGPLRDITTYSYRVTAFSFATTLPADGSAVPIGDRFLESSRVVTATPQAPLAGTHFTIQTADTIMGVQAAGASDGTARGLVLDPYLLTGNTYRVDFGTDTTTTTEYDTTFWYTYNELLDTCDVTWDTDGDSIVVINCVDTILDSITEELHTETTTQTFWNLTNTSTNTVIMTREFNLSGDDDYKVVDGMLLKVAGPPLEGKDWDYIPADPPNVAPGPLPNHIPGNGRWFTGDGDMELLFGGAGLSHNFFGSDVEPPDVRVVEFRWRPFASFTDLNDDTYLTPGEPYVVDDPTLTQKAYMYTQYWNNASYEGWFDVPFQVWDVTDEANPVQLNAIVRDRDGNHQWEYTYLSDGITVPGDTALPNGGDIRFNYIWAVNTPYDSAGTTYGDGTGGTIGPFDDNGLVTGGLWTLYLGDRTTGGMLAEEAILRLTPNFVITPADTFVITTTTTTSTSAEADLALIKAVPNPYYLYGGYDPAVGNRQIKFHHLPAECTITIYNLAGEFIQRIEKDDPSSAIATWNVQTENSLPVASGIYIYVVEAPGFGTKIGKLAVFVEDEVLDIY